MKPTRLPTIRSSLVLLVLTAALPVLAATAVLLYRVQSDARASVERDIIATARALVVTVDSDIASAQTGALVLSTSPDLLSGDLRAFYGRAKDAMRAGVGSNVVLTDRSGQQILNTLRPYGAALPHHGNPALLRRVFETGKPAVSDLYVGGVRRDPVISVEQPVRIGGKVVYDLSIGLFPERLGEILRAEKLPATWVALILDSKGVVVASTRAANEHVGKPAVPDVAQQTQAGHEGALAADTLEGIPVSAVFSRSSVSGWTVVIGIPVSELADVGWKSLGLSLVITIVLVAAGLIGTRFQARRLAKPLQALEALALAHGRGEQVDPPPLRLKEADDVARALIEGARQLRVRTAERDKANEQRQRTEIEKELIEKDARARSAYFAYLSHELGSPLMAIRAFAEAITKSIRGTPAARKCQDYCHRISTATTHLLDIIGQILAYSRIDAHEIELHKEELDVTTEINEAVSLWEAKAVQGGLTFNCETEPRLPPLFADRTRLRQIFFNLISNAVKFTHPGGTITITAKAEAEELVIRVADTGIGISAEDLPHVLLPFVQGAAGRAKGGEGSGLGLPFSKGLAELHGGTLQLESVPGVGTTVTVRFPVRAQAEPHAYASGW